MTRKDDNIIWLPAKEIFTAKSLAVFRLLSLIWEKWDEGPEEKKRGQTVEILQKVLEKISGGTEADVPNLRSRARKGG